MNVSDWKKAAAYVRQHKHAATTAQTKHLVHYLQMTAAHQWCNMVHMSP